MKKLALIFAFTTLLRLTACGDETESTSTAQKETSTAATTESIAPTEGTLTVSTEDSGNSDVADGFVHLKSGVWFASTDTTYQYYSGSIVELKTGTGVPFRYEVDDDKVNFYPWSDDSTAEPVVVTQRDESSAKFVWDNGTTETLTYLTDGTAESFTVYSNTELCTMALSYYASQGEDATDLQATAETNADGTVTIQLYRNVTGPDGTAHNSTATWYSDIDRTTAKGMDESNTTISLIAE